MPFRVEVVQSDDKGVTALRFEFDRPLNDPEYRFFISSPRGLAQEVRFGSDAMSFLAVDMADPRALGPIESRDFERLRRMEITSGLCLGLLGNWPF